MTHKRNNTYTQERINSDYDAHYDQLRCHSSGQLYKRLLTDRGLEPGDIAAHFRISVGVLSRFWTPNVMPSKSKRPDAVSFTDLIDALGLKEINGKAIDEPLDEEQIELLNSLYKENITVEGVRKLHSDLYFRDEKRGIVSDFTDFHPGSYSSELVEEKVDKENAETIEAFLEKEWRPAFLSSRDWSIHAFNKTAYLFFIAHRKDPEECLLKRDTWHLLAGKLADDSRIRDIYRNYDSYFSQTVAIFAAKIYPYLFTVQIRYLVSRLQMLSAKNGLKFGTGWKSAEALNLGYEGDPIKRTLACNNQSIQAEANIELPLIRNKTTGLVRIPLEENMAELAGERGENKDNLLEGDEEFTGHWIGIWEPLDGQARNLFKRIAKTPTPNTETGIDQGVFYAADYERRYLNYVNEKKKEVSKQEFWNNHPFHINHRPWVETEVQRILYPPGRSR